MGLLDYYRQFEDIDEEEVNKGLRERRAREKALALEQVPGARPVEHRVARLPELGGRERVDLHRARQASTATPTATRASCAASARRSATASPRSRSWSATAPPSCSRPPRYALLGGGGELVTPWPSYPLYPLMASRAGGRPVAVELRGPRATCSPRSPSAPASS